jgi:hypothetical protein
MLLDSFSLPVKLSFTHTTELHRVPTDTDRDVPPSKQKGLDSNHITSHEDMVVFGFTKAVTEHTLDFRFTKFELTAVIFFSKFTNTATYYTRPP